MGGLGTADQKTMSLPRVGRACGREKQRKPEFREP